MQRKLIELMQQEDLCDDMKFVAEVCGFETAKTLVDKLGGVTITIPKAVSMRPLVNRYIKVHRHKKSARMIALELNLNERTVVSKMNLVDDELSNIID